MDIALVSLNQAWQNKEDNISRCRVYINKASQIGSHVIIFPEMTLTGFTMSADMISEELSSSPTIESFRELAEKYRISIIFGMVVKTSKKPTNCLFAISSGGDIIGQYSKIHTFSLMDETKYYQRGSSISFCTINELTIGLTICYDLRFSILYDILERSSQIIVNIANWPAQRIEHWYTLLKARAIENQVFIIGVNRTGTDGNGIQYIRSSKIINPFGIELNPFTVYNDMDIFSIEIGDLKSIRNQYPFVKDKQLELYRKYY